MRKKYKVTFRGHRVIFAESFDKAKKSAEEDLKFIHPNMNMKFESVSEVNDG